ncbi:MAG: YfhO family protein, partial [Pirellulales bacterium]
GLLYQVQTWLPVVGKFRFPCRMIVLFQFALAVLAAIAWYCLVQRLAAPSSLDSPKSKWPGAASALLLASVAAGLLACWRWPVHAAAWPLVVAGPALLALAVGLVTLAARRNVAALYALALLAAVDWGLYGLTYAVYRQPDVVAENIPESEGRIALNARDSQRFAGNESTLTGRRRIDGYAGLTPRQSLDYSQLAALQLAGVEWVAEYREVLGAGKDALQRQNGFVRIDNRLPRTWLVGEALATADPAKDLLTIDPRQIALVESPLELSGPAEPGRAVGESSIVRDRPGKVELAVRAQGDALLILTESFHSGWQASVDGQSVNALRVYGDFIGIPVPDGASRIELRFRPVSLRYGALLSACGLILLWAS